MACYQYDFTTKITNETLLLESNENYLIFECDLAFAFFTRVC